MPTSTAQQATPNRGTANAGTNAWPGWDIQVLHDLGVPPSKFNQLFLDEWQSFEKSNATNNPLNLTRPLGSGAINSDGVQNYNNRALAAQYTANNIRNYPTIYSMLKSDSVGAYLNDPNKVSDLSKELRKWGSGSFADFIQGSIGSGPSARAKAGQIGHDIAAPFEDVKSFFKWVAGNWDRILFVLGGAVLLLIALLMLYKSQQKTNINIERGP